MRSRTSAPPVTRGSSLSTTSSDKAPPNARPARVSEVARVALVGASALGIAMAREQGVEALRTEPVNVDQRRARGKSCAWHVAKRSWSTTVRRHHGSSTGSTHRAPKAAVPFSSSAAKRRDVVSCESTSMLQAPPRSTRVFTPTPPSPSESVHSNTLPAMSCKPSRESPLGEYAPRRHVPSAGGVAPFQHARFDGASEPHG